jgi:hypothetical protein
LGERLRCSKERATVNNHSVMRALVVDAIADLGDAAACGDKARGGGGLNHEKRVRKRVQNAPRQ